MPRLRGGGSEDDDSSDDSDERSSELSRDPLRVDEEDTVDSEVAHLLPLSIVRIRHAVQS